MPNNPNRMRVLIADDHDLIARALSDILAPHCEVVGTARNGMTLLQEAARLRPNVVSLDISMPGMNGLQAAVELLKILPNVKIVFVTQQLDPFYLRAAFRAGAVGFVSKQSASTEILTALRQIRSGGNFISPVLARENSLSAEKLARDPGNVFADPLTRRQREVLQLVAEGSTIKEISAALSISAKTVEFHKNALMNELGLRTTAELTRYALSHRIVS